MSLDAGENDLDWTDEERMLLLDCPEVFLLTCDRPELGLRFVPLFGQAWSLLPCEAIGQIAAHWQPSPGYISEMVVLQPSGQGGIDDATPGITLLSGHRIEFHQQAVARLPDRPLIGLIVHELAHVYCHATGDSRHKAAYQSPEEQEAAEESVKDTLKAWGLDCYDQELQEWLDRNTDWYEAA